ncbi:MAG: adenosylmethionine decarboxylase [Chloroflexi bacterium]|nr:adenosylmethionine decarboxylase [Chloroflexota bacterium]
MHLIVDGYGGDVQKMQDLETIYTFLDNYPAQIGMTKIAPPYVFRYIGSKPQDWGISGFVLIAESHISVHTFPERAYINIDMFSCKEFDAEKAIRDLQESLGLDKVRVTVLDRGLEYLDHGRPLNLPDVEVCYVTASWQTAGSKCG